MHSRSTVSYIFSSDLFVAARTGVRFRLGACTLRSELPISLCQFLENAFVEDQICDLPSKPGILRLKLLDTRRSRSLLGCSLRLLILVKRFHQAQRLGHFDPGMALRHEGFRLAQLGDDLLGRTSSHAVPRGWPIPNRKHRGISLLRVRLHPQIAPPIGQAPSPGPLPGLVEALSPVTP